MTTRSTSEDATPRLVPRRLVRQRIGGASVVLIIAASIAIIAAMLPVLYLFVRGIGQGDATIEFLARPNSMFTLWRTINLIFIVTLTSLVVAVPAAWLTMNSDLPFKRFIAVALALPLVVPSFVMATTLIEAFGPKGALQRILQPVGVDQLPSIYGLPGSTLVLVLMTYPYVYLTVRAAIAGLNPELIDACRSMGYTTAQAFRRVTLPLLIPAIGSGSILAALYTLSDYGGVALMRHNTLTVSIMTNYQTSIDRSSGAALSMMLVVFAAGLLLGESLIKRRRRFDDASANAARSQRIISLGRYKAFALLFTLLPVVVGVIVPCLTMLRWLTRGIESGQGFTSVAMPLWNSMQASALAAVTTVIVALPIAFVTVRYRNAISEFFSQATYIGFGLPGVVVALSIVFFAVNFALFAYQTLALLIFAYAVSFLPRGIGFAARWVDAVERAIRRSGAVPRQNAISNRHSSYAPDVDAQHLRQCCHGVSLNHERAPSNSDPRAYRLRHACDLNLGSFIRSILHRDRSRIAHTGGGSWGADGLARPPRTSQCAVIPRT